MASATLLVLLAGVPSGASATILEKDLDQPGDGLLTLDTETGLEWLDLSVVGVPPGGPPGFAVEDILAGAGGWVARGFRYATEAELCDYFTHLGLAPTPCPGTSSGGNVLPIIQLIGSSSCCPGQTNYAMGAYEDGGSALRYGVAGYRFSLQGSTAVQVVPDDVDSDDASSFIHGHFLVRTAFTPAPALGSGAQLWLVVAIGVAGALGLASRSRLLPGLR